MEKIIRPEAPGWLKINWEKWGREWADRYKKTKKSISFRWRQCKRKGYNDLVRELAEMTRDHCSFCDAYPMRSQIPPTIEHFRPKTRFPLLAYQWENLFICCGLCQEKGDEYDERLLKPDEEDYTFDKYFDIVWAKGELKPNRDASEEDQERARITIKLYRLNDNGKPESRIIALNHFLDMSNPDIDQFSYRFFIKRGNF